MSKACQKPNGQCTVQPRHPIDCSSARLKNLELKHPKPGSSISPLNLIHSDSYVLETPLFLLSQLI